jgi:hypothetical protein
MRQSIAVLLLAALAASRTLSAWAVPITVPAGLNVGDKYRLVFVTSQQAFAVYTTIDTYNGIAAGTAFGQPQLAALGTTWTAIASTSAVDARDNTATNPTIATGLPIYRLDGTKIADNNADLWDGSLDAQIRLFETGTIGDGSGVWTGTDTSGVGIPTRVLGSSTVRLGNPYTTGTAWIDLFDGNPMTAIGVHLYALSGELTVVPEPGTFTLIGFAAVGLAGYAWRVRRRKGPALLVAHQLPMN